jgi:hypothetical protein
MELLPLWENERSREPRMVRLTRGEAISTDGFIAQDPRSWGDGQGGISGYLVDKLVANLVDNHLC